MDQYDMSSMPMSTSNIEWFEMPMLMMHNSPMMEGLDTFNMGDSNDSSYTEEEQQVYTVQAATQTIPSGKIKPVTHPGLVLKSPIAYQGNVDPSVIPIQKDGIAVCEKCGAIGVKHAFYTRERRFCSMACARGYSGLVPQPLPNTNSGPYAEHQFKIEQQENYEGYVASQPFPQIKKEENVLSIEENLSWIRKKNFGIQNSFNWDPYLRDQDFVAAPVSLFPSAPMCDSWDDNILVGMKVEVENTDTDDTCNDSFWVASVIQIVGYKALLRYEGFLQNLSKDFWVSMCSNQVHPVGWCASIGKPLIPPKSIQNKCSDWKKFLRKRLTGARTLPTNYGNKIVDSLESRFQCGLHLEVVDKNRISQVKVAIINKIIGKRLNVKYYDSSPDDAGFWCHEDSPLLHPVGWAKRVGHNIVAPANYMEKVNEGIFDDDDAFDNLFTAIQVGSNDRCDDIRIGMKLEAIDPLNLSSICAATVMNVLNCGYIMIRIDSYAVESSGADWFCYHKNSPCIFPVGFCESNNITLVPPKGCDVSSFRWDAYLRATRTIPVPINILNKYVPPHGFKAGMKLEAADLMDPRLVCVATVAKVVGRLLRIHFDGWEEEYDQWLDCYSPDIYPVGWCCSVGYKLEGPPTPTLPKQQIPPKVMKKRGRKKKIKEQPLSSSPATTPTPPPPTGSYMMQPFESLTNAIETPEFSAVIKTEVDAPSNVGYIRDFKKEMDVEEPTSVSTTVAKVIPRLVDSTAVPSSDICPNEWTESDVSEFLRVNDCANYCDAFMQKHVDGKKLLDLNKEDILELTGCKVGPSLKIYDLVQQLKIKLNPSQLRQQKAAAIISKIKLL